MNFPPTTKNIQNIFKLMLQDISETNSQIIIDNYPNIDSKEKFVNSIILETITDDNIKNILKIFVNQKNEIEYDTLESFLNKLDGTNSFDKIEDYLKKKASKDTIDLDELVNIIKNLNG